MTLLQSLIRLIKPSAVQSASQPTAESDEMNPLGWYASEQEKAWGDMEDVIGAAWRTCESRKGNEN